MGLPPKRWWYGIPSVENQSFVGEERGEKKKKRGESIDRRNFLYLDLNITLLGYLSK